jgi:hypothetical protein
MDKLSGVITEFSKPMVLHNDVSYFGQIHDELVQLTITHGKLNHAEILIEGYNDDHRSLYEVPEVRRWVKNLHNTWPDSLLWLTPGSLWFFVLSLNPQMHQRLPDGRLQIELDPDWIVRTVAESQFEGKETLTGAGMAEDVAEKVMDQAENNLMQMFEQKKLGDYVVLHPKDGKIVTFKS